MSRSTLIILSRTLVGLFALWGFGLTAVFFASRWGLTNSLGIVDPGSNQFAALLPLDRTNSQTSPDWAKSEEWGVIRDALLRDSGLLNHVSALTGVAPRLVATAIVPEQLRLFHSEREVFKSYFGPLRILGTQTQFSWGIAGLKEETAKEIEVRTNSPLLAFQTDDPETERFRRLTDHQDHYWSYLYTALYLKQIMAEWEAAGYPINERPEILATLFNIGFANSQPKADPRVGGSAIQIEGQTYSFGGLAYEFYYSDELPAISAAFSRGE